MTKKLFVVLVVITAMLISFSLVIAAKKAPFRGTPQPYEKQTVAQQSAIPLPVSSLPAPITPEPFSTSNQPADRVIGTWPTLSATPGDILWCCPLVEATEDQFLGVESLRDTIYVTGAGGTTSPDPNYVYAFLHAGGDVCTFLYKHPQPTSSSWGWRDIACDGEYLYASDTYTLECFYMTPAALVLVPANNIAGPISPVRAVAYDAGRDWFWTASFSSDIYGFDRSGTVQAQYPNSYPLYGMAYDGVYLWCHSQDNTKAYQFDVVNGVYTGVVYAGCDDGAGGIAGGLSLLDVDEGKQTMTLVGVTQSSPDKMYAMEIEITGGPTGCCEYAGTCDMLTEDSCNTLGGTWYASPYDCIDNTCQLPVDSVCHLQWDNGSAAWYASSFAGGDEQGNYYDPETMCPDCGPDVYPFLVTQVSGLFYDHAGVGPMDVIIHFYSVGPDTCSGPGAEIYSFGATVTTYYPDEQFFPLPEVLCLEEDFIVTAELSGTEGSTPCVLWSSEAFQNCIGWIWHHTYGAPPWLAMEDLWAGGGYHMLRVDGICNSGACAQGVECYMFQGTGSAASYWSGWGVDDGVAKYYDPEVHCTPPVYPVKISDIDVAVYDHAGMGTVDVEVVIYVECSEPCDGPGTEIYHSDPITVTTFYPSMATITLPDLVCVFEPFFVGIHYPSGVPGSTPSVLFDNGVCDTCHAWMWYESGGASPPWIEWSEFWSPPPPGCPMIYVVGYTEDPACDFAPCDTTIEEIKGGQFATYYWKQPPNDEFLNMRFQMPATHGGRLEYFNVAWYAAGTQGTPDPDMYVWLSDGMFPLDNNPPYQAVAEFHITFGDIVFYPGYTTIQSYDHNLVFDPGEMFHIGGGHAYDPDDTLAWLSDDGSFLSDRASGWYEGAWETYYPYEFMIDAYICPYAPEGSTFTMGCSPALAFGTPGDVDVQLYQIDVASILGYNLPVNLSLLAVSPPENITAASFTPNNVPCPFTSDVGMSVGLGVPYGLYTLTFQAIGTDGQTKTCDVNFEVQPPYDEALVEFFHGMQRTSTFGAIGNGNLPENFVWYGTNYLYDGTIISAVPGDPQEDHMALDVYDCEHVGFIPTQHLVKTDDPWCPGSGYEEFYGEVAYSNFYVEDPIISCEWDSLFVIGLKHVDCTDFSIKIKIYYNPTPDSIPELWAGVFEDWDVGDYGNNWGDLDVDHNLMYMYDLADPSIVFGIMKCPFYPEPMTSMVFVYNPEEVYPTGGSSFNCGNTPGLSYLFDLMTGGHRPCGFWSPDGDDRSTLIVGPPFSLNPGEKHIEIWIDFGRNLNDGLTWQQWYHKILRYVGFYRGDVNASDTLDLPALDVSDLVYLMNYLYKGGPAPDPFADQGDVDGQPIPKDVLCPKNNVDAGDVVYLINYVWKGGPAPIDYVRYIEQYWSRPSLFLDPNWQ